MNIFEKLRKWCLKKNPEYIKLRKKYGYGITKISDNYIVEITKSDVTFYKVSIAKNLYGIKEYDRIKHRIDGPAYITIEGSLWYIHGFEVTNTLKYWAALNDIDIDNLTEVDITLIRLQFLGEFGLSEDDIKNQQSYRGTYTISSNPRQITTFPPITPSSGATTKVI